MSRRKTGPTPLPALFVGLLLSLLLVSCSPSERIVYGESVGESETIENNLVLSGTDVVVDGDVDGDVYAAGRDITINGNIGGSLYAIGELIAINGQVDGNLYTSGVELELGEDSSIGKSVYFAGARVSTQPGSQIGWDLAAVSLGASLAGEVGRETRAMIGAVELANLLLQWLGESFDLPNVPNIFPSGEGSLPGVWASLEAGGAGIGTAAGNRLPPLQAGGVDADAVLDLAIPRLKDFAVLLILGGLLLWLLPNRFLAWNEEGRRHPIAATGYGFVIAIVGYVGFGLIAVLLTAVALGLIIAGFWELSGLFSLLSLSTLGLAFGIFLLFAVYGSKVVFSFLVGWLILRRFDSAGNRYRILALLLGLLVYEILRVIPYFGVVFAAVVTFFGLGAVWMAFVKMRRGEIPANVTPALFARTASAEIEAPAQPESLPQDTEPSKEERGPQRAGRKSSPS